MKPLFLFFANSKIFQTLFVLTGLFFIHSANAQKINPIVKVGVGFSDWKLSEESDLKTGLLPAFSLGVFAEVSIHNLLLIESGFEFSHAGAEIKFDEEDAPNYSMGYLNLPVLGKLRLENGITFYTGPQIGFLLSANEKEENGSKQDVKSAFKDADFSLVWGITYALKGGIDIGFQITHGLANVYDNGNTEVRNRSLALKAGYIIPMPKA